MTIQTPQKITEDVMEDEGPVFALEGKNGVFHLSMKEILFAIQIAEHEGWVPPIPEEWKDKNIPKDWRMIVEEIPDEA